jgi:hypothetical protein
MDMYIDAEELEESDRNGHLPRALQRALDRMGFRLRQNACWMNAQYVTLYSGLAGVEYHEGWTDVGPRQGEKDLWMRHAWVVYRRKRVELTLPLLYDGVVIYGPSLVVSRVEIETAIKRKDGYMFRVHRSKLTAIRAAGVDLEVEAARDRRFRAALTRYFARARTTEAHE